MRLILPILICAGSLHPLARHNPQPIPESGAHSLPKEAGLILTLKPEDIHWQQLNTDGSRYAVIEGDRSKAGAFTYAFYLPKGVWVGPHRHSGTARVFVVSGTLLLGEGEKFDPSSARRIETGEFFLVPANAAHWEGAETDTLIVGVGSGPWTTTTLPLSPSKD